jgi:thiol-disulfide isomerase/thioredoxin
MFNRPEKDAEELTSFFLELNHEIRNSSLGKELRTKMEIARKVRVGQSAPTFSANSSGDSIFSTASLKGNTVYLLSFGATWCQPYKEKYPVLKKLYEKYREKGLEIVAVNLDEKKDIWRQQIISFNLPWVHVSELKKWNESEIAKLFDVQALPYYLLVDKIGMIAYNSFQLKDDELILLERYILSSL